MTGVSHLPLALAVHQAGAMPSLLLTQWQLGQPVRQSHDELHDILQEFWKATHSRNLAVAVVEQQLLDPVFLNILAEFAPSHIDFLPAEIGNKNIWYQTDFATALAKLPQTKFMIKAAFQAHQIDLAHGYCIKGHESGGVRGTMPVRTLFALQRQLTPHAAGVPYGGVSHPSHVREYLAQGAAGVAVGTLFAACRESCLSEQTKQRMVEASSQDLHRFADTGQQALILGNTQQIEQASVGWNRSPSLWQGITGDGTQGHVYAGTSIDHVTKIRTVKETVEYLVSELH